MRLKHISRSSYHEVFAGGFSVYEKSLKMLEYISLLLLCFYSSFLEISLLWLTKYVEMSALLNTTVKFMYIYIYRGLFFRISDHDCSHSLSLFHM